MTLCIKIFILFLLAASLPYPASLSAEEILRSDIHLRPAIVYNIAKYVTWPTTRENEAANFTIGIIGNYNSTTQWNSLNGKRLHGKPITVRRVADIEDLSTYQIIYIESDEKKNIQRILEASKDYPILTISQIDGFSTYGGMITLRILNGHMAFNINLKCARQSGLIISSNVLKLATEVIK